MNKNNVKQTKKNNKKQNNNRIRNSMKAVQNSTLIIYKLNII